jgi:plastocyanin
MHPMIARAALAALLVAVTAAQAGGADHTILQKDKAFSQVTLTIKAGDRIVFTNTDPIAHNVYSITPSHEFELRTQLPGKSEAVPFGRPGSVEVLCAIHPKMKLKVTVTQ